MTAHLQDAWRTIVPEKGNPYGPLPTHLVLLTLVTGLVDAFSFLELGRVFVANMTGNVVFLSFALGGAEGFLWWASALGVLAFLLGAFLGGRVTTSLGSHRGRHLLVAASIQSVVVTAALIVAILLSAPYRAAGVVVLVALLGVAMGLQNATARALKVPDLTTTVLTLTMTGISADSRAAGGRGSKLGRRAVSILSMFLGGLIGAALIVGGLPWAPLALSAMLLVIVVVSVAGSRRSEEPWTGTVS